MAIRRYTDSVYLQFIWDAIEIPSADHICTFDHILRFIRAEKDPKCDVPKLREHLGNALRDNCVVLNGSQYKKPDWLSIQTKSAHDSYCFHCHLPGPVVDCPTCFRVFHETCSKRSSDAKAFVDFPDEEYRDPNASFQSSHSCVYCRRLSSTKISKETKSNLRNIYSIIIEKMRGKNPWRNLYTVGYVEEMNRNNYFCTKQMNTRIITEKLRSTSSPDGYPTRTHILADLDLLVHNAAIIYGSKAEMTATARSVRSILQKELRESSLCVNCYMRSKGGRPDQRQIVQACPRPHELIWFQYGSWSFRPCKVLYKTDEGCEVVCFDVRRERLFAPTKTVFKMNTSPLNMGMRITPPLKRALLDVKKYVENQRMVTPDFVFEDSLLNCDVPPDSPTHSDYADDFPEKKSRKSSRAAPKRRRPASSLSSSKITSQSKFMASPDVKGTGKAESSLEKARVPTFHPASRDDAPSPNVGAFRAARIYSSDSDSDENSASSSSSDSDSDYPPAKRPTYRSVALPPSATNATTASSLAVPSSRSSDSTSPAVSKNRITVSATATASAAASSTLSTNRPFSSRAAVTDSDSDPASSPLESSGSPRRNRNSPLPICRKRNISSSSSSDDGKESDSSSSTKSVLSSLTSSKNKVIRAMEPATSARNDPAKARPSKNSVLGSVAQDAVSAKILAKRVIKKAVNGDAFATAPKFTSDPSVKRNSVPPVSNVASSISSVSPAALSSSSGIGSAASVDAKSVEASPGDLLCNGHVGPVHADSRSAEDHSHQLMNARIEVVTLQLDKANKRIQELERTIQEMERQHKLDIENTKRHAWCRLCLKQSVYYCCPGASYCSTDCQKEDWTAGHSKICRRCNSQ